LTYPYLAAKPIDDSIRDITMTGHWNEHGWWVVEFTDEELKDVMPEKSLEKTRGMWLFKGYLLGKNGRYKDALKFSEEVLKINPRSDDAWWLKGASLEHLNRHEEAIMCFDKALTIDPKYEDAWCAKGITLRKMGRHEDAIECLIEALKIYPRYVYAWCNRALALWELGRYEEAIKCVNTALNINPKDEDVISLRKDFLDKLSK